MNRARTDASTVPKAVLCFFSGQLVSIFLAPLSPNAAQQVLAHNTNVNLIFEAAGFTPIINEIQGPGFNPLWQEVDITFIPPFKPQQFTSATTINDAANASQITLTFTNNVFSVPVVGPTGK